MKLLLIDNYDSFTYNLLHLFAQIKDVEVEVVRNDAVPLDDLKNKKFHGVIIGPGPGDPSNTEYFGDNMRVIKEFGSQGLPILGVCLGFQGLALAFGATLKQAKLPQHGKTSKLFILQTGGLFSDVPQNVEVMRYHSLMIDTEKQLPKQLIITAEVGSSSVTVKSNGREIMAFQHQSLPLYGLQFHPESFATELGDIMANNFVDIIRARQ